MSEQVTMSMKDTAQIEKYEHDDELCAKRVMIVGGSSVEMSVDSDKIANAIKESLSSLKSEQQAQSEHKAQEIKVIEVPAPFAVPAQPQVVTIKEPVIVLQKEVQIVEVPVMVKEIERVEVPVIVKELVEHSLQAQEPLVINKEDKTLKIILIAQIILTLVAIFHK